MREPFFKIGEQVFYRTTMGCNSAEVVSVFINSKTFAYGVVSGGVSLFFEEEELYKRYEKL
jgi:hypothetical protein